MLEKDTSLADEKFGASNNLNRPIHLACEYGRLEFVKKLIEIYQVDINSVCPLTGFTPLMYAVQARQLEIVKYLIEN